MNKVTKSAIAGVVSLVVFVMGATAASATSDTSYTAAEAKTAAEGFLGQLVSGVAPILLSVAGGVIGLLVLGWAIRLVFSKVRSFAHF